MGLPIGTALFGLGIGIGARRRCSATSSRCPTSPRDGGDDRPRRRHRLRPVHRHPIPRGLARRARRSRTSVAEAIDTSGRAVLFAGTTVIISLLGLFLMGLRSSRRRHRRRRSACSLMMIASLTLLPALLGWVGDAHRQHDACRADRRRPSSSSAVFVGVAFGAGGAVPRRPRRRRSPLIVASFFVQASLRQLDPAPRREAAKEQRFWYRWSRIIQHRPWPSLLGAASSSCSLLAIPLFSHPPRLRRLRQLARGPDGPPGYDLLAEGFGPGTNGPLFITVEGDAGDRPGRRSRPFADGRSADDRTSPFAPSRRADRRRPGARASSTPTAPRRTRRPTTLVDTLRDDVIPADRRRRQGRRPHRRRRTDFADVPRRAACRCSSASCCCSASSC